MRALLCALTVFVASTAHAATLSIDVVGIRFVETGTPTVCLHCEDADANNDLAVSLGIGAPFSLPDSPSSSPRPWGGGANFTGTTLTDFTGIDLPFVIDIDALSDGVPFATTALTGRLYGIGDLGLVLDCCLGDIANWHIQSGLAPPAVFTVPPYERILGMEITYRAPAAIPEPASILLLSTGVVALLRRKH